MSICVTMRIIGTALLLEKVNNTTVKMLLYYKAGSARVIMRLLCWQAGVRKLEIRGI